MVKEKICLNIIRWGTYLILFTPLIVSSRFFFPFISPKGLYFMALSEIIFVSWLVLILFFKKYRPKFNSIILSVSLFIFVLFLATVFSVDPSRSFFSNYERMAGFLMYFHLFFFFLVCASTFNKRDWIKIFSVSLGVTTLVSILFFIGKIVEKGRISFIIARNGSTLGNSSFLASYLLFNLFFGIWLLFEVKNKFKPYLILPILLISLSLFSSGGRAASFSFILGLVLIFFFYLAFFAKDHRIKIFGKLSLISLGTIILISVILLCIPGSFVQQKFIELSTKARPLAWQMAISGFKERPILGWGPETFELVFDKYFHPCFFLKECGGEIWFDRAHNIVFDTLASSGILGLISYLLIYAFSFKILWKKYFQDKKNFWTTAIFSSLLIAYFIQGLTVFDAPASLLMLFLTFGFLGSLSKKENEKTKELKPTPTKILICLILFVLLIFSLKEFVYLPAKASTSLIKAFLAPTPEGRLTFYKKALHTTSLGKYQLRAHLGDFLIKLAQQKRATKQEMEYLIKELEKTIEESPKDFRSYVILGKLYLFFALEFDKSRAKEIEALMEKGIKISPRNQQGYWLLAQVEFLKENCKKAISLAKDALNLEPRVETSLILLERIKNACQKKSSSK
jgi:O-antigen ligase